MATRQDCPSPTSSQHLTHLTYENTTWLRCARPCAHTCARSACRVRCACACVAHVRDAGACRAVPILRDASVALWALWNACKQRAGLLTDVKIHFATIWFSVS